MGKEDVIIVAHSLSGVYVPQAIVKNPNYYRQVIYLASIITEVGERAIDFIPEDRRASYYELTHQSGDGTFKIPFDSAHHNYFHDLPQHEARDFYNKMTPQPLNIYLEQQSVSPKEIKCKKDYIICTRDRALPMELTMVFGVKSDAELHMLDSTHDAMLTKTKFLAEMLDDIS
jgi:hypothetical protein